MRTLMETAQELIAEAEATLTGEPILADDELLTEENAGVPRARMKIANPEPEAPGWYFIDRQREAIRIQLLLKSPSQDHIQPVLRSLGKVKQAGLPAYEKTMAALDNLAAAAPNCADFLELIKSQIHLHHYTQATTPLRLMPTLLVGPPGVGKTYIVRQLAECLGMYHDRISLSNATESFVLSGCPKGYATSTPGEVAEKLAFSDIINPLLILDELDKASYNRSERATVEGPLLTLLEPETANRFEDASLRLTIDVSHVSWIGTANSVDGIPEPVLSRFLLVPVVPLAPRERQRLLMNQVAAMLTDMGLQDMAIVLTPGAQEYLGALPVRSLRNILRLSIARKLMASPSNHNLEIAFEDIVMEYRREPLHRPIGFHWSSSTEGEVANDGYESPKCFPH